jgi:glycosyltransferase involved in cell wall biosynthesis
VITPVYNRASLLPETIESIIAQTYTNWELLLIDDGSDEQTTSLLQHYQQQDKRIQFFKRNREPKSAQTCRNIGFIQAKGEYLVFLDSDDLLAPFCFRQRIEFMKSNPDIDFAVFPGLIFNKKKYDRNILISNYKKQDIISMLLLLMPPFIPGNIIWKKKSLADKKIMWDENIKAFQDVDFHLMAAYDNLLFAYSIDQPDYFWRKHNEGSISSNLIQSSKLASHRYFFKKHTELLKEKRLYNKYHKHINRLGGQLLLLSFKSDSAGDTGLMINFLKQFGKPFSAFNKDILVSAGRIYGWNNFFMTLVRVCLTILYPSIFPLFSNKTSAKIKWKETDKSSVLKTNEYSFND